MCAPIRRCSRPLLIGFCLALAGVLTGCQGGPRPLYVRLLEARRLAADLRVQFSKAADASNRAVMADTDEASIAFAREAEQAKQALERDAAALEGLLGGLDHADAARLFAGFRRRLAEYQALDRRVLELAVQNTNLKAQRLSFGPAQETADAFRAALDAIARAAPAAGRCQVESAAAAAIIAVREVQVLQAPHIAESDDARMTSMEKEMDAREKTARDALASLSRLLRPADRKKLDAAVAALDRFEAIHTQIVALSRKNTNVYSMALALGQMRTLTTACDASIVALQEALAQEGFKATR